MLLYYKIVFGMVNVSFNDFFHIWHALKNKGSRVTSCTSHRLQKLHV